MTAQSELEAPPTTEVAAVQYWLVLDPSDVVTHAIQSNLPQPDAIEVPEAIFAEANDHLGLRRYADGVLAAYEPPPLPAPVPASISSLQFAQILALDGVITQAEALAWAARGELPEAMRDALAEIPEADNQRFAAEMLLSGTKTYERSHPLVPTLGALLDYDAAALDDIWTRAAAL